MEENLAKPRSTQPRPGARAKKYHMAEMTQQAQAQVRRTLSRVQTTLHRAER